MMKATLTAIALLASIGTANASCISKPGGEGWKYLVSRSSGAHCWYNPKNGRPQIDSFRVEHRKKLARARVPAPAPVAQAAPPRPPITTALASPYPEPPPIATPHFQIEDAPYPRSISVASVVSWPIEDIPPPPTPTISSIIVNSHILSIASLTSLGFLLLFTFFPLLSKAMNYLSDVLAITLHSTRMRRDISAIQNLNEQHLKWVNK